MICRDSLASISDVLGFHQFATLTALVVTFAGFFAQVLAFSANCCGNDGHVVDFIRLTQRIADGLLPLYRPL